MIIVITLNQTPDHSVTQPWGSTRVLPKKGFAPLRVLESD